MNSGLLVPDQQTSFICMYLGIYHSDQDRAHFQLEGSLGCLLCQYQSTPLALSCTCYSDVNQHGLVLPVLYLCIRGNILHVLFCVWLLSVNIVSIGWLVYVLCSNSSFFLKMGFCNTSLLAVGGSTTYKDIANKNLCYFTISWTCAQKDLLPHNPIPEENSAKSDLVLTAGQASVSPFFSHPKPTFGFTITWPAMG